MNSLGHLNSAMCFARIRLLVSVLSVLCVLCGSISAQEWKTVADGVEYAQVRRDFGGKPVDINLLRLDLKKVRLDVHHAMDRAIGLETTSSIAKRHKAFAAINAGFFRLDTTEFAGDSVGVFIVNGRTYSEGRNPRTSLVIENGPSKTELLIHQLQSKTDIRVGKQYFKDPIAISGIDRDRKTAEVILYGPEFGTSTKTVAGGHEVILSRCKRVKEHRGFWFDRCSQLDVKRGSGNNTIPRDGFVLSFAPEASPQWAVFEKDVAMFKEGKSIKTFIDYAFGVDSDSLIYPQPFTDAVTGVPQLIKTGKIDITWEEEKASKSFVETRHPRTAVAKLRDGKFLMLTADGRTEQSAGLDLYDLAEYMLELGAIDAMNLDGGGSTTMFLDGKVVNRPSDKEGERKVSDAILVTLRNKRKR